jgi:hypothetical protein
MEVNGQLYAPPALPPEDRTSDVHCILDWMGSKAGLDAMENRNVSYPYGNRILVVQPVA